jgi:hypothetical protein
MQVACDSRLTAMGVKAQTVGKRPARSALVHNYDAHSLRQFIAVKILTVAAGRRHGFILTTVRGPDGDSREPGERTLYDWPSQPVNIEPMKTG